LRIAIVNDMLMAREALRRVIAEMAGCSVAWTARDGAEAVKRCAANLPELILMDLFMPVMGGVEATRLIMAQTPCAILVVTGTVEGHTPEVFEALGAGALDAVPTPVLGASGQLGGASTLELKIEQIRRLVSGSADRPQNGRLNGRLRLSSTLINPLVVIGASAGGPAALATILSHLPSNFSAPMVIVQHIDAQFAPSMAGWLAQQSALAVRIAYEGDQPAAGMVLIASSNDHLVFLDSSTVGYTAEPRDCFYRPSVDVFFESVASHWKGDVVAVLLTGMGRDGARGLKGLRAAGALTIAQDADSCVVYGMPKAAAELGAAVEILPLQRIASYLTNSLEPRSLGGQRLVL
jgi:two-component system, chemotaxis family, response regulator WspF